MTKTRLLLLSILVASVTSCTKTIEKNMNSEDLKEVAKLITEQFKSTPKKGKYVNDNMSTLLNFVELGKKMGAPTDKIPTFKETIEDLSKDYDSISDVKLKAKKNNAKLKGFVELVDAETVSISKYKGYLKMKLKFNNEFDKDVLYAIINYKYVNEYDTTYFDEKSKLTDKVADNFKGEVEISTKEEYNDIANFMYTKVPQDTMKEFLLKGMKVSVTGVVFKDKSELTYQDADWEYFD
ncbi:hypothetical protein [Aquimarina agarivorans]|uniref:hypothetical protein n=1 Tax=Aquimarina agarivorans TaxID=980584 RepID=UPI0002F2BE5A|nr:hypothetical protein [Aquimarina agarivorans]